MGVEGGIMIGVEYPKRGENGKAGYAQSQKIVRDDILRALGPQMAAEMLTRQFKEVGFEGPDVCADITSALRLRLHVIGKPSTYDLALRKS